MDEREQREWRLEHDVDEVADLDIPRWYLRLTAPVVGHWRRKLGVVIAVLVLGLLIGAAFGFGLARRLT